MIPHSIFDDILHGRAIFVTGAGISAGGKNSKNQPIIGTNALAQEIALAADLPYAGEDIKDVFDAAAGSLGTTKLKNILERHFIRTTPSDALVKAFSYPWRRVYTFNIDDTIERIPHNRLAQRLRFYNAVIDRREEWRGYQECQVVHLHGLAASVEHGIIFSTEEYAEAAARSTPWYTQLGEDFVDFTVIFVGTSLKEQLVFQSIKSAVATGANPGTSYCLVPDDLSPIQQKSLERRGIIHIKATLEDFVRELSVKFPNGLSTRDLDTEGAASKLERPERFTAADVEALRSLFPLDRAAITRRQSYITTPLAIAQRRFYEGYGPNWRVLTAGAYARLTQYETLASTMFSEIGKRRLLVVLGEAGSGKSTFVMDMALRLVDQGVVPHIFEYVESTAPFHQVMQSLKRYVGDQQCVVILDNLHVSADEIAETLSNRSMVGITLISSARIGEWHDRLAKIFTANVLTLRLDRFKSNDVPSIIAAVEKYFAVPAFNKLPMDEKLARFRKGNQQLLIAMIEATESKGFREIIEDEFSRVTDKDQRSLLLTIAMATVPRIGVAKSMAGAILTSLHASKPFEEVVIGLQGIVDVAASGRFQARHQIYASEIIQNQAKLSEILPVISAMVGYYLQFKPPIIKSVSTNDGQLFKYLLNNNNVYQLFKGAGKPQDADKFFSQFEISLQLDGHFWLQYGLLLRRLGKHQDALNMFARSIAAYPNNPYAHHAQAQQKLIFAAQVKSFTASTIKLIDEGVAPLIERHLGMSSQRTGRPADEYPIVTLGYYHVDALMAHGQSVEAAKFARKYFKEIDQLTRTSDDPLLSELRGRLMMLVSTGDWPRLKYREGQIEYK